MARRGSYAKGVAKRDEILERGLEVIAREGYSGASVKVLAEAVGLSQAGLLHYFESREELFTEILRRRDRLVLAEFASGALEAGTVREDYVAVIRHNTQVPGFVQLFSRLAVDAADPKHPAHEFFLERGEILRGLLAEALTRRQAVGAVTDRLPPETLARILQAVLDGLQLQWMLDRDVDMAATVEALFDALDPRTPERAPHDAP